MFLTTKYTCGTAILSIILYNPIAQVLYISLTLDGAILVFSFTQHVYFQVESDIESSTGKNSITRTFENAIHILLRESKRVYKGFVTPCNLPRNLSRGEFISIIIGVS